MDLWSNRGEENKKLSNSPSIEGCPYNALMFQTTHVATTVEVSVLCVNKKKHRNQRSPYAWSSAKNKGQPVELNSKREIIQCN